MIFLKNLLTIISLKIIKLVNNFIPKKNNQIIFFSRPEYSDNSLALYKKMLEKNMDVEYTFVWAVENPDLYHNFDQRAIFVSHKSFNAIWKYMRSKYIVRTHSFFGTECSRRQKMINVWHGMPLKRIGEMEIPRNRQKKNHYDYMPVTGELFRYIISQCFNTSPDRNFITGLPRNDFLFSSIDVLSMMNIETKNKKVILWMPTFRKSSFNNIEGRESETGLPVIGYSDIHLLKNTLEKLDIILLIKPHQFENSKLARLEDGNLRIIKNEDIPVGYTIYHILSQCDALLTDFSSVYVDYLILDRPIGFVYDDIIEYKANRGFIIEEIESVMPGETINDFQGLLDFLYSISKNFDNYSEDRKLVNKQFNRFTDNRNSERLIKTVWNR